MAPALELSFEAWRQTLVIVIAVIFLFLGSVRALIIPVVAIPLSQLAAMKLVVNSA